MGGLQSPQGQDGAISGCSPGLSLAPPHSGPSGDTLEALQETAPPTSLTLSLTLSHPLSPTLPGPPSSCGCPVTSHAPTAPARKHLTLKAQMPRDQSPLQTASFSRRPSRKAASWAPSGQPARSAPQRPAPSLIRSPLTISTDAPVSNLPLHLQVPHLVHGVLPGWWQPLCSHRLGPGFCPELAVRLVLLTPRLAVLFPCLTPSLVPRRGSEALAWQLVFPLKPWNDLPSPLACPTSLLR